MLSVRNYNIRCLILGLLISLLSANALSNTNNTEGQWMLPQDAKLLNKSALKGNRIINALRSTKNALRIDFQKTKTKYVEYKWDNSWTDKNIKLNMRFRFH